MKQIVHIFRKDVRQHRLVILITLATQGAFAWDEPRHWLPWGELIADRFRWIPILLFLTWWILVVRVIQSEALAGDRQYWITRPIEWSKLLAAKMLFVLAFVSGPALVVDVYLLHQAGFKLDPAYAPGLLWSQLELAAFLLLTVAALAAVTTNIGQLTLAILGVGLFMAGTATAVAYLPPSGSSDIPDDLTAAVVVGACAAVVVRQYARRKTQQSRLILGSATAVVFVIAVATPFVFPLSFPYPALRNGEPPPVQISLDPAKPPAPQVRPDQKDDVGLQIPLRVSGIEEDSVIEMKGTKIVIESLDGKRWDSGWFSGYPTLFPGSDKMQMDFRTKKSFFEETKRNAVNLRISFALTVSRDRNPRRIIAEGGYFAVPDLGLCRISNGFGTLFCRFPIRGPRLVVLTTASSENTCRPIEGESMPAGKTAYGSGSNTEAGPLGAVGTISLSLGQWNGVSDEKPHPRICPGTPLLVSFPQEVQRVRTDLDLPGIRLAEYQESNDFTFEFRGGFRR